MLHKIAVSIANVFKYIKVHLISIIILTSVFAFIYVWLLPQQSDVDSKIAVQYSEIANLSDSTGHFEDPQTAHELQGQVARTEAANRHLKYVQAGTLALFGTVLAALLGTLLQFLYTNIPFTKSQFHDENGRDTFATMPVLAVALACAALIVIVSIILVFWPL